MAARTGPSSSSHIAGSTRAAVIADEAAAASSTPSKYAAIVAVATGTGRSRTVAPVITARVPSEPVSRAVRS